MKLCRYEGCENPKKADRLACQYHYNIERRDNIHKYNLWSKFRLRPEDYQRMFDKTDGACYACGRKDQGLQVDHDHKCCKGERSCGKCVRGLLCGPCNRAIAAVNDDPQMLLRLVEYLQESSRNSTL